MQLVCGSDNALTGGILSCGHLYRSKPLRLSSVHLRLWHKGVVVIVLCTLSYPDSYNKVTGGSLEACTLTRILSCTVQLPYCTALAVRIVTYRKKYASCWRWSA